MLGGRRKVFTISAVCADGGAMRLCFDAKVSSLI